MVKKPVDPVFINFLVDENNQNPSYGSAGDDQGSLDIDIGEWWRLDYSLEAGKKYHVFLVGDWICNETEPQTDYDIKTTYPDGSSIWNTESAGLPEQVANDDDHQYFVPPMTGTYRFEIFNDDRDSKACEPAIFMLIEHIDVNTRYSQGLEGRDEDGNEVLFSGWAYEFNTIAPKIRVFVDVPDSLDMYEVRLYMMADPDVEIGYSINELGVPSGDLFIEFDGEYGGYNTSCKGDRNIDAMDSCEHSGRDMEFAYDTPNAGNRTSEIFYYLALIAEHDTGTIEFYFQTDFDPPEITPIEPPIFGYEGEKTKIEASINDESGVQRAWVEFRLDDVVDEIELSFDGENWIGFLPYFQGGDFVEYEVSAMDEFGSTSSVESEFLVKREASIVLSMYKTRLIGHETAEIHGRSSLESTPLTLTFTNGAISKTYEITTDEDGSFNFTFTPDQLGQWTCQASYVGSEITFPTLSDIISFTLESRPTQLTSSLSRSSVKVEAPVYVRGSLTPRVGNMPVEIMFVSSSTIFTEIVYTDDQGAYHCVFEPADEDTWNVLVKFGDGFYYEKSQSTLLEFEVRPLTMIDKVQNMCMMLVRPPYLYGTFGVISIGFSMVLYTKRERIAPLLPKSIAERMGKPKNKKKKKGGTQSYKRSKK
ncbi:MAG: hypothetical protein JSV27_12265 [Candidatus Bathyarchaeota archaeon]|nr:MAG: hypothetical protein JSV27_12265 [Candidatus Bathyarchaeota archaeon]